MDFIKGIFNAKVGDRVNVVGNGTVVIQPGFHMIFTANLKSDKNPERQALPPQIAREFEQNNLEIPYVSKAEAYDIIKARLWQRLHTPKGSIRFSWHDLQVTLPNLCAAMTEIQRAYTQATDPDVARVIGELNASGAAPGLKKLVLTQGTVEAVIDAWWDEQQRGTTRSFVVFLDDRLKRALTFGEYPAADRQLAAKILAAKGLLRTLSPTELGLPADTFNFEAARAVLEEKAALKNLLTQSLAVEEISLSALADLDPFGTRTARAAAKAVEFLPDPKTPQEPEPGPDTATLQQRYQSLLQETYRFWYPKQPDKATVTQQPTVTDPHAPLGKTYAALNTDTDPANFGAYTLNRETVRLTEAALDGATVTDLTLPAAWTGKPLHEIAQHIADTHPTAQIADLAVWSRMLRGDYPQFQDGQYYFCFGSLVRAAGGHWEVPSANWNGGAWHRNANRLDNEWTGEYRVVLLVTWLWFHPAHPRGGFVWPVDLASRRASVRPLRAVHPGQRTVWV